MLKLLSEPRIVIGCFLVVLGFTSCVPSNEPPERDRGIRVWSTFDVTSNPPANPVHLMSLPPGAVVVSGVLNFGNIHEFLGPPSSVSGLDPSFAGETNRFGISDHKFIRDNAVWDIQVNYQNIVPGCGTKVQDFNIPPGGANVFAVCFIRG